MSLKNNNNKNEIVLNYDAVWADIWGGPWLSFDFCLASINTNIPASMMQNKESEAQSSS